MDRSLPPRLKVIAWPDPVIDALGFAATSAYSELAWTPILGPASVLAYRRLAGALQRRPDGYDIDVVELAQSLGLGQGTGAHAPVSRTLRRLAAFQLAVFVDDATYAVRRRIPPLSGGHLRRLSPELRRIHDTLLDRHQAEHRIVTTT